ncbi:MAG: transketolase [Proteobacteria bacterium]|nr:transketolase [Pseudomonadota bacterium]MBU1584355.1 transketolase [Pseudomonadota bacterium]MBU2455892.1 transketolase [Pseudomonadota bacterium]
MRNAFIEELVTLARQYPQIALVIGDIGYSVIEPFADEFPERFINAGIAEQNMAGLAAGMASEGYHVFTYSIANFPIFRCAEQIRNDIDYHKLAVTVVAVGGGLAYGNLGYSHHAVQDYALMRTMPNMLIAAPGDPMEVRACMRYIVNNPQPSYLRLGKAGEPCMHSEIPEVFPGKWLNIWKGKKHGDTYLTTGATLEFVHQLITKDTDLKNWSINSMPMWSMKVKEAQARQVEDYATVLTVEDHLMDGGFGSWLLEATSIHPDLLGRIKIKSLDAKVCGMVGKQSTLNAEGGLYKMTS